MRENWKTIKLGDLCRIELGKTPSRSNPKYWDKDRDTKHVWLSIADLPNKTSALVHDSKEYLSDEGAAISKIVPKGTLLVSFKLTLGRLAYTERDLFTNEAIAALYLQGDSITQHFLYWYLTFFDWQKATEGDVKVKGKTLNKAKLKELAVLAPPLPEQERIVSILDKAFEGIDKAIAQTEQNLASARELFESYLNNIFTQKGEDWVEKKLEEVCSKIGSGATPKGGAESYKTEGISLIRSLNVYDWRFTIKKLAYIDDDQAAKLKNVIVEEADVLFNITGASVARCCVVPNELLPARVNQHVSILRPKQDELSSGFLCYLLTSRPYKEILLGIGDEGGSTRQAITKKQLQDLVVSFPDLLAQQTTVASLLEAHSKSKSLQALYTQKLNDLKELKQSLLQQAFAGELTKEDAA